MVCRNGSVLSSGASERGIVAHAGGIWTRHLPGRLDPVAALAAVAGRERPVLVRHGGLTVVAGDPERTAAGAEAWEVLDRPAAPFDPEDVRPAGAALAGGWIGLLAYDLAGTLERLPPPRPDPGGPPRAALGRYDTVAAIAPDGRVAVHSCRSAAAADALAERLAAPPGPPRAPGLAPARAPVTSSLPEGAYGEAVEAIRALIRAGDCYQVNLAQRLTAPWRHGALTLAARLWAAAGPAAHAAYLGLPEGVLVSASPELLVASDGRRARSAPIKGTAPPGGAGALRASGKDRAEHVMIVDLVRNDLGRVAEPGGVWVERLMGPLRTPYVEHLVSDVRARLAPGTTPAALLAALFPGGSVTGAPKLRAMEVIRELEPVGRGPAYGSVVAVGADGGLEASVAIRTAWVTDEEVRYWCGGAVVWESEPEAERREAWAKAAPFLRALAG